jgi:phytoene dehydrogenase-like protein
LTNPARLGAVVIGSGPNGLAAAIVLARRGYAVTVYEGALTIGGGARSAELTLPGFVHDVCSAVHPLAVCSPCFEQFPLAAHGLKWIHPDVPLAHPLDDGSAVVLEGSISRTAANLGGDGEAWGTLFGPLAHAWPRLRHDVLAQVGVPRHPLLMARFGMTAVGPARRLAESRFQGERARALFAGLAAHSGLPLEAPLSAAPGLVLGICAHTGGWPFPCGGAQRIADALAGYLRSLDGEIRTASPVASLPDAPVVLCDVTPRQMLELAGRRFPTPFRTALGRYRYGPGAFKVDWALDGPIPWRAAECARAGTVHLGGTLQEIAQWEAQHAGSPFVLLAQHTLFDATRAPAGKHTAWAYCHVPNGSTTDMTDAIEAQVERFAPGFRQRILARHVFTPAAMESHNPNLVGGDFNGGALDIRQFLLRPTRLLYQTPLPGVYFCGSSTPPGGGVHGMCGFHAASRFLNGVR